MVSARRVKLVIVTGILCIGFLKLGHHFNENKHFSIPKALSLRFGFHRSIRSQISRHHGMTSSSQWGNSDTGNSDTALHKRTNYNDKESTKREVLQKTSNPKIKEEGKKVEEKKHDKFQTVVTGKRDRVQPVVTQERDKSEKHLQNVTKSDHNIKQNTKILLPENTSNEASTIESFHSSIDKTKTERGSMYTPTKRTSTYKPSPRLNSCNLPNLNPWDSSISHLLNDVGFDPGCSKRFKRSLYDVIDNRLVLMDNSIKPRYVSLEMIERVKNTDESYFLRKEKFQSNGSTDAVFKSKQILGSDFFRISYSVKGDYEETHYYARVVPRQDVIEKSMMKIQQSSRSNQGLPLNVLMLGFDSTSNANFVRKMPHTLDWLSTKMRSYVMKGYSIVGDGTTPALTAVLTGRKESSLPEGRIGFYGSKTIDQWPWISKLYEEKGYVTLFAEDDPQMGSFNLRLKGFSQPPFHHYMRPFWLAIEDNDMRDEPGICSRGMSLVNYTMDYFVSVFEAYKDTPKFALGFLSYLTHAHPNHLSYGDFDVLYMLKKLQSLGYLNETLVILFGDHGSRNDNVRSTMQGKLEERLPWLSISVPEWLESSHPELIAALANNEQIISSPFDLHATLRHVLSYPQTPKNEKFHSFFTSLPRDRTCQDAGIDEHWCPCLQFTPEDPQSKAVSRSAQAVIDHINRRLTRSHRVKNACHVISLVRIHGVMKYEPNDKVQTFYSTNQKIYNSRPEYGPCTRDDPHYLITMETSPMGALFEATVAVASDDSVIVNPNISRINLYGDQPKCIERTHPYLRKFCVCRT